MIVKRFIEPRLYECDKREHHACSHFATWIKASSVTFYGHHEKRATTGRKAWSQSDLPYYALVLRGRMLSEPHSFNVAENYHKNILSPLHKAGHTDVFVSSYQDISKTRKKLELLRKLTKAMNFRESSQRRFKLKVCELSRKFCCKCKKQARSWAAAAAAAAINLLMRMDLAGVTQTSNAKTHRAGTAT